MELKEMDVNQKQFIVNLTFRNHKDEFKYIYSNAIRYLSLNPMNREIIRYGFYVFAKDIYFRCFNQRLDQSEWNKISEYKTYLNANYQKAERDFVDALCGYY